MSDNNKKYGMDDNIILIPSPKYKLICKRYEKKFKYNSKNKTDEFNKKKKLAIKLNLNNSNLLNEINSINGKNNKNLVNIYEYWNNKEDNSNLVMELCNSNLFDFIKKNIFYERYKVSKNILNDILNGLYEFHNNKYSQSKIHHDIKPENILYIFKPNLNSSLNNKDINYTFKVTDFGCSNKLYDKIDRELGTFNYLPPEIYLYFNQEKYK